MNDNWRLTFNQKLVKIQLNLPHGTKKNLLCSEGVHYSPGERKWIYSGKDLWKR